MQNKKIVVFASGGGSNFAAIAESCRDKTIKGDIVLLVASKDKIGAVAKAALYEIPVFIEGRGDLKEKLLKIKPDLICLAGYLKKVPQDIIDICPVMNIHPALLPKFGGKGMYGEAVHKAVIKAGERESGATVHFIDVEYDQGTVIDNIKVPVFHGDGPRDLAKRVLSAEHCLYPRCVKLFCEGKL
jgi:folate-dependent phosphoribosylglycinamide formyltransferase PurN